MVGIKPHKTTLEQKKEYALSRGYELQAHNNPTLKDTVHVVRISDGVEFMCNWKRFEEGVTPKKTTLKGKVTQVYLEGYEMVGVEKNPTVRDTVTFRNLDTGDEFTTLFNSFINDGVREKARYLNSKGEAVIDSYLRNNLKEGYTVSVHYRLELGDNRGGNVDFAIINSIGEVEAFIEYNGIQHYKVVDYFGEDSCKHTQESDRLKGTYAKENSIPLLIIPYTIKRKEDIVKYIKENHSWYLKEEYTDFQVVRTNKYMTTLEEKKEQARSVGWELLEEENFATTTSVKMKHGDEEITRRWDYFLLKEVNKTLGTKTKEGLN